MPDFQGGVSQTQLALPKFEKRETLRMTFDRIVAVVACVATVICTVIAVLSYLKNKDE